MLLSCVLIFDLQLWISQTGFTAYRDFFYGADKLMSLNFFPVFCVTLLFCIICPNALIGSGVSCFVCTALTLADRVKIEAREDALIFDDLALAREAMEATSDYKLDMHFDKFGIIIAIALILIIIGIFFIPRKNYYLYRVSLFMLIAACLFNESIGTYTDADLYKEFQTAYVEDPNNVVSISKTLGANYYFLHSYNSYPIDVPDGFDKNEMMALDALQTDKAELQPNIIIVMCEAFNDIAENPVFKYNKTNTPLKDYYEVIAGENVLNGHMYVPSFGAGTANTEFDVMTGMQTNLISEASVTSSFRSVKNETKSIASLLKDQGYDSYFMHPGDSWFYNRSSVYKYLGIDDQVFIEAFGPDDYTGKIISDAGFLRELKEDLQSRLIENDNPLFAYTVSIQNHQAYRFWKYERYDMPKLEINFKLSDDAKELGTVYMNGIRDSAAMLKELVSYLDEIEEPTLLVFFGDHMPAMQSLYDETNFFDQFDSKEEETLYRHRVPFIIKANKAYADSFDFEERLVEAKLEDDMNISSSFLASVILDITNTPMDGYFECINKLRKEVPVYMEDQDVFVLADGSVVSELPDNLQKMGNRAHGWMYYRLKFPAQK